MRDYLTDRETAKILGKRIDSLYKIVDEFDRDPDDEWALEEGVHFEDAGPGALNKDGQRRRLRRFSEEGVEALARYVEATEKTGVLGWFRERLFHAKKKRKQLLVARRVTQEFIDGVDDLVISGDLAFVSRRTTVAILQTNYQGLNNSWRRLRLAGTADGEDALQLDRDFIETDGRQILISQKGIRRVADDMLKNSRITKSRQAWIQAVGEVAEGCIELEIRHLTEGVSRAIERAKNAAGKRCEVTGVKTFRQRQIDLDGHHLFDRRSRPDLADFPDNILVLTGEIHREFHGWKPGPCAPRDFLCYLETVRADLFDPVNARSLKRMQALTRRLNRLQVHEAEGRPRYRRM